MFEKIENYNRVHGIAHRRGAPAVGAPALTRQFVLTCDHASYAAENDPADTTHPKHLKNHLTFLDWQIHNLRKAFIQLANDLRVPEPTLDKVNTIYQHFLIDGLFVKAILELYKDYLRVLVIVEVEPPSDFDGYVPLNLSAEEVKNAELSKGLRERLLKHLEAGNSEESQDGAAQDAHRFIRRDFWDQLDEILCIDSIEGLDECKLLLDMRGCMLASADTPEQASKSRLTNLGVFADQNYAKSNANVMWRLSSAGDGLRNKEYVCCTLFRENCIYMSSIGSHIGKSSDLDENEDTTFFIASTPRGQRWQVGRLMYRINEIASFRLMALKNMEEILRAGTEMKKIGSKIERLSDVEFEDRATMSKLAQLQEYKNRVDNLGITDSAELGYKIERSQYFARRFRQAVGTIDTGRIEGWQPYTDFIERRLQPTFEKISDVKTRFDGLLRLYHAQLAELDSELQRQSSEHLVEIQTELLDSSSFQHKIESIALAYYGGTIVFTILFGLFVFAPETFSVHNLFGLYKNDKEIIEKVLKGCVFICSALFAVGYFRKQERRHHEESHKRKERLRSAIRRTPGNGAE